MGYENNGGFEALVNEFEEGDNLVGVSSVKISGRFVSQDDGRTAYQAPCDGYALLFAP
jgi:hypothetical protein